MENTDDNRPAPAPSHHSNDYMNLLLGHRRYIGTFLATIFLASCIPIFPPELAANLCDNVGLVIPSLSDLEVCRNVPYNIPNFAKVFSDGADVLEQVNMTGANSERRKKLAVEVASGFIAMSDLKVLVTQSNIPQRTELAEALGSYAKETRNTAELLMKTDFQAKVTLDKIISEIRYISDVLDTARGKNMGRMVKRLWKEFKSAIRELKEQLKKVLELAAESKISLEGLEGQLQDIQSLIHTADKNMREGEVIDYIAAETKGVDNIENTESIQLLKKLANERELAAKRIHKTLFLLGDFIRHLEAINEPAYTIVVNKDPHADNYVKLVRDLHTATARMIKVGTVDKPTEETTAQAE